jgi:hypothetical protein
VAGKDNNLYLGGLSGVRRVEIKADGTLKNRELVTTGEIHNLARYENTLYGANGGEIEIFSIAENGSITEVADFDASACTNIRINDGILFTAEKKKVKVYDLTDPTSPQLIKTISTSGKVIDLEVIGKKLYIYEETTSWFTTKGYTGIYDISDISSPVRTGYFKKRCNDAEMQRSGETIHLGCKNGQYRVKETGLVEVSGEKNYVREGYVYDGILYQVFSGALHKSKTTGIEIVCGNGIVEPGEICDSDTLNCSELDVDYIDGTATCNSTCSGYNEGNCESDGW